MNSGKSISKLEIIKKHIAELKLMRSKKGSVKLIAVSKTKPMDEIKPVIDEAISLWGK